MIILDFQHLFALCSDLFELRNALVFTVHPARSDNTDKMFAALSCQSILQNADKTVQRMTSVLGQEASILKPSSVTTTVSSMRTPPVSG